MHSFRRSVALVLLAVAPLTAAAWGRKGHLMINRIAAEKLPAEMPAFMRTAKAADQMEYQGPEPDRWRSYATEPELVAAQAPEHFIDIEWADLAIGSQALPRKRYDFIRALAAAQPQHTDIVLTPEKVGLQPYVVTEIWERLKNSMRDYRLLEKEHKDTTAVEAMILYYAGWLGHYVADGSQPLHVSYRYNGWVGDNPNGYTTEHSIHSKFESLFVNENVEAKDIAARVPMKVVKHGDIFDDYMAYLRYSNTMVEKVYMIEKAKGFDGKGTPASREFVMERITAGATELRDLIVFAWEASAKPLPPYKYAD